MAHTVETDVVVVGTGPGGAGLARDLVGAGLSVHILEMGRDVAPSGDPLRGGLAFTGGALGTLSLRKGLMFTRERLAVLRGVTTGGSSMLYLGTAYDPDPEMWQPFGFDLAAEAAERKREIGVAPLPDHLIGEGSHALGEAACSLDYPWQRLNKFVDQDKCVAGCNECVYGCRHGAKWHARDWVLDAVAEGATLLSQHTVSEVLRDGERAVGVVAADGHGQRVEVHARKVVVAAGGIGSPMILRRSGIMAAGARLFFDPFVMTTGVFARAQSPGVMMATGMHLRDQGIMFSDMQYPRLVLALQGLMARRPSALVDYPRSVPLMIKIRDDMTGSIDSAGKISKRLTADDRAKLAEGKQIATAILTAAGARTVWHSPIGAAHPGGTCAMGRVVDANFETQIRGLHVCDASVIPVPFGIPPTLTCLALARRLSRHLARELNSN